MSSRERKKPTVNFLENLPTFVFYGNCLRKEKLGTTRFIWKNASCGQFTVFRKSVKHVITLESNQSLVGSQFFLFTAFWTPMICWKFYSIKKEGPHSFNFKHIDAIITSHFLPFFSHTKTLWLFLQQVRERERMSEKGKHDLRDLIILLSLSS